MSGLLQRRPQVVPAAPDWPVMTTGHIPELSDSWGRWDSAEEAASLSRHAARRARRPTLESGSGDLAFKIQLQHDVKTYWRSFRPLNTYDGHRGADPPPNLTRVISQSRLQAPLGAD